MPKDINSLKKIGPIPIPKEALFLAPMEDVSDKAFRELCKAAGADFVYTEFVSSDALIRQIPKSIQKMQFSDSERPFGIQLYGNEIEVMAQAAEIAAEFNPDIIDINFGCPVRKIANRGGGSGMLRDIPKLLKITETIVRRVDQPVSVKTRLGWDHKELVIVDLAEALQDIGVKALTIHGRTREQLYSGEADWSLIGKIKENPRMVIPIIGNGDVNSPQMAKDYFNRYGVDGIMIGRAAIGNPSIFKFIRHYLETGEELPPLSVIDQINQMKRFIEYSVPFKGSIGAVLHARRHMAANFKSLANFRAFKIQMLRANTKEELWQVFEEIGQAYS